MPLYRTIPIALLATVLAAPPASAQRSSRATIATTPQPSRIVLERTDVGWCFDQIRARVDLDAPVNRRVGMRVSLRASPPGVVEVPRMVVARPWANFVIRGKHPLEAPSPLTPPSITVTLTAEANGGSTKQSFTIRSGPRVRQSCQEKIRRAEETERMIDINRKIQDSTNEQNANEREKARRTPR